VFIFAEKTVSRYPQINRYFIDLYYNFKRSNGYTETEIASKRESLENILVPYRDDENIEIAINCGFRETELLYKWLNFSCYCAVK
jgi:tRNA (cmo5U34)-methyltransferase